MKNLEEVLKELKEAEKEYQEKCLKYGIEEKNKRKAKTEEEQNSTETVNDNNIENVTPVLEETNSEEKSQENK